ncbi:hypothetical protein [Neorhizobium sp. DT-125]|uniref:hypothetical protein n=1 Tax=Neorhizobium sp. DT-125 TaxID=3396163 RepID=UPI003F1B1489
MVSVRSPRYGDEDQRVEADRFSVTIDMDEEGRHTKGPARLVKGALQYANVYPGDSQECAKIIRTVHRQVEVDNVDPGCRYGSSSYFAGRYLPVVEGTERAVDPAADLLGYGIILKPEDDARLRLLLGDELYRRMARTFEASMKVDILDAGVTNADIGSEVSGPDYDKPILLQAPDGRFWVAFRNTGTIRPCCFGTTPIWRMAAQAPANHPGIAQEVRCANAGAVYERTRRSCRR